MAKLLWFVTEDSNWRALMVVPDEYNKERAQGEANSALFPDQAILKTWVALGPTGLSGIPEYEAFINA